MKSLLPTVFVTLCLLFMGPSSMHVQAQTEDTLFVYVGGGQFDAFPRSLVLNEIWSADGSLAMTLADNATISYSKADYDSVAHHGPYMPRLTSFKFNNKFNDEMPWDVEAEPRVSDGLLPSRLELDVPSITKYLTPSFQTDVEGSEVYVDGELQKSKVSRHRFDDDIVFSTSLRGCRLARRGKDGTCYMGPYGRDYTVSVNFLTESSIDVPRIEIDVDGGKSITSRSTYRHAAFRLYGNGVYEDMEDSVWIKGRGNSSWGWPKKPYRLKFDEKVKPFGLKAGKSWVLLSNYQRNSMMSNAIGMKAARLAGTVAANHIIPVDLYLNGEYRGSYNFTEKVGTGNNSVDLDEEAGGVLLELDQYYDEERKFYSDMYYLPVNVKDPDMTVEPFKSEATELFNTIKQDFNNFCVSLSRNKNYEWMIDVDAFARFMMVNDLILNYELGHPKSTYVHKAHIGDSTSPWVFGPVWDLDWGYGYEDSGSYYRHGSTSSIFSKNSNFGNGTRFFRDLLKNSDRTKKAYYRTWYYFMQDSYQELIDYIYDYFDYADPSFQRNAGLWGDGYSYGNYLEDIRNWLDSRTTWIMRNIEVYDLSEPEPLPFDAVQDVFENPEEYVIVGGDALTILAPVPGTVEIYSAGGMLVQRRHVDAGTTVIPLPAGIYIVNHKKVAVR